MAMIGSARVIVLLTTALAIGGCVGSTTWDPPETAKPLLSIGEWLSFVGRDITFLDDGRVVYHSSRAGRTVSHLAEKELATLKALLASPEFMATLQELRASGYQPGCCDLHEVALTFQGEVLGFPVCEEEVVPSPVAAFIDRVNELAGGHFRHLRNNPLPKTTCEPSGILS